MTPETAKNIAISALNTLAGDQEQLSRFIALTGVNIDEIREIASSDAFLTAVLDYFLGDEASLLAFAAHENLDPADIQKARFTISPPEVSEF